MRAAAIRAIGQDEAVGGWHVGKELSGSFGQAEKVLRWSQRDVLLQ